MRDALMLASALFSSCSPVGSRFLRQWSWAGRRHPQSSQRWSDADGPSSDGQGKVTRVTRVYDRGRKPALFTLLMLSFQPQAPALFFPSLTFLLPLLYLPKLGLHQHWLIRSQESPAGIGGSELTRRTLRGSQPALPTNSICSNNVKDSGFQ